MSLHEICRRAYLRFAIFLLKTARFCWRRSRWVLAITCLLTVFFMFTSKQVRFVFAAEDMVGEGLPSADELRSIKERFSDGATSLLVLTPQAGTEFTAPQLCALRKWYSLERATNPDFKRAFSSFDLQEPGVIDDGKIKYRNLIDLDCSSNPQTADVKTFKDRLDRTPWAFFRDKRDRLNVIFAFTFKDSEVGKYGSFDPMVLSPIRDEVENEIAKTIPGLSVQWVGPADYQWYVFDGFKYSGRVNLAMLIFLILAIRICYGSWASSFLFGGTLLVSSIWIFGMKGLSNSTYDVLTSGLFLMLGISSMQDFTFLSAEQMNGSTWRRAVRKMLVPCFFTSLTTVMGFLSLGISDLPIIRRFGLWAATGALLEWAMIFILIPCFLGVFIKRKNWVDAKKAKGFHWFASLTVKSLPRGFGYAAMIVFPLAVVASNKLSSDGSLQQMFPPDHRYTRDADDLMNSKGWVGSVSLMMDDAPPLKAIDERVEKLRATEAGANIVSVETPESSYTWMAKENLFSESLLRTRFQSTMAYKQLVDEDGGGRALLYLKDTTVHGLEALKSAAEKTCAGTCHLAGELVAYADFSSLIPMTLLHIMHLSLALVALVIAFLAIAFRQARFLPHLLITSFWGPLCMLTLMGFMGISMDFMKCTIISVLVGLTGDNAIQFLCASKRRSLSAGVAAQGGTSIQTILFMAGTSLFYLFSKFAPPKEFGVLLATGLVASLIGDLWLLNAFLPHPKKEKA